MSNDSENKQNDKFLEGVNYVEHRMMFLGHTLPKDITIVEIGNKKYYAKVDSQHRYSYLKFKLVGDVDETETVRIS